MKNSEKQPVLCCWCDNPATSRPLVDAGVLHPACEKHYQEYRPILPTPPLESKV
jgi:hypothetical protein